MNFGTVKLLCTIANCAMILIVTNNFFLTHATSATTTQASSLEMIGHQSPPRKFFVQVSVSKRVKKAQENVELFFESESTNEEGSEEGYEDGFDYVECGGTVLGRLWVLTAADCFSGNGKKLCGSILFSTVQTPLIRAS